MVSGGWWCSGLLCSSEIGSELCAIGMRTGILSSKGAGIRLRLAHILYVA
jgi:hypothetical protein